VGGNPRALPTAPAGTRLVNGQPGA